MVTWNRRASRLVFDYVPQPAWHRTWRLFTRTTFRSGMRQGMTTVSTRLPKYSVDTYKLLESKGQLTLRMGYGVEMGLRQRRYHQPDQGPQEI